MKAKSLIIVAYNIRSGGGAKLFIDILEALNKNIEIKIFYNEDLRFKINKSKNITLYKIKNSIIHKIYAEILVKKLTQVDDIALFFGNLPPLFSLKGKTIVYLYNVFILKNIFSINKISFYLKNTILKLWFFLE